MKFFGSPTNDISEREIRHSKLAEKAAAEGIVLLENNGILPLKEGSNIALYGGGARYTVIGGTGSGSVNYRKFISIDEGLRNEGFHVVTDEWLSDYDSRYVKARESWKESIFKASEYKREFSALYRAFASHPFIMPVGKEIQKEEGCDTAIYVVSRISGEGADRTWTPGDYRLSETEKQEIKQITELYPNRILVLNIGGIIDLSVLEEAGFSAVILLSQPGMAGGNALGKVLKGEVCPSGKLTDTWAYHYRDYPSSENFSHNNGNVIQEFYTDGIYVGYRYFDSFDVKPRYPFGYGLSYTEFAQKAEGIRLEKDTVTVKVNVKNIGECSGKDTVFVFVSCPGDDRASELKMLTGFKKSGLLNPGEEEQLEISFPLSYLERYHTGKSSWYLASGLYYVLIGENGEKLSPAGILSLNETAVRREVTSICPLIDALKEIKPGEKTFKEKRRELSVLFEERNYPVISLDDVCQKTDEEDISIKTDKENISFREDLEKAPEEDLLSKLSVHEMARLVCGQPSAGSQEFIGAAATHVPGAAGETSSLLTEKFGLDKRLILADGPAGLRLQQHFELSKEDGSLYTMDRYDSLVNRFFGTQEFHEGTDSFYQYCTAIPIGTMLAQTFNPEILEELGELIGREMQEFGVNLWLAPGMNIHRNPLCGRNYEYYSEDPVVSGKMAAAITRGVQKFPGCGTTIKHLCCNNQEENRMGVDSILSEKALREIYLKGFEIAVKESQPKAVMTSYNKVNGIHTANSYDLCTEFLRNECGFEGIIMTDWMTTNNGGGSSAAKCIHAGNDLIMPGNVSDILEIEEAVYGEKDLKIEEKDLRICAGRVLKMIFDGN